MTRFELSSPGGTLAVHPDDDVNERQVVFRLQARTKIGAIKETLDAAAGHQAMTDTLALLQAILNQEAMHSYRREGDGLSDVAAALVHARSDYAPATVWGIGIAPAGIPWTPPDGGQVHLLAVLVAPHGDGNRCAAVRDRLLGVFRRPECRRSLVQAASPAEVIRLLRDASTDVEGKDLDAAPASGGSIGAAPVHADRRGRQP